MALGCALIVACGNGGEGAQSGERAHHGTSSVGGQVVSTVNGVAITLAEVSELVSGSALSPAQALRRLQEERLLAAEAQRRGMQNEWPVAVVAQKAAVQALLDAEANTVAVTDAEIEAEYQKQRARFEQPEKRMAAHLLARVPADADASVDATARAVAEKLLPTLAAAPDDQLDQLLRGFKRAVVDGISIVAERIPAVPQVGRLEQPFADAMFSLDAPGMVPEPVRTSYGWHAIRLTQIVPALHTPQAEAYATIGEELLGARRKQHVDELLARLAKAVPVQLSEDAAQSLAGLALDETALAPRGGGAF